MFRSVYWSAAKAGGASGSSAVSSLSSTSRLIFRVAEIGTTARHAAASPSDASSGSKRSFCLTVSTLLTARTAGAPLAAMIAMTSRSSSVIRVASTIASATSTPSTACLAVRLRMRFNALRPRTLCRPGVSTSSSWAESRWTMPRILCRVVCGLGETIERCSPTSAFTNVDLPTLGRPITAIIPQRCTAGPSGIGHRREDGRSSSLLRAAPGAALTIARQPQVRHLATYGDHRCMVLAGGRDLPIVGPPQTATLEVLLQPGLGILE